MMVRYIFIVFLIFPLAINAQGLNIESLKFNKLDFYSSKADIIRVLGEPKVVSEPKYECGFLSSEEQGKKFFLLDYSRVKFVGNDEDEYVIDELNFTYGMSITYKGVRIDMDSSLDKLIEVFGMELFGFFHDTSTDNKLIRFNGRDDGVIFYLKNGQLSKLEYWSPC